MDAESPPPKKPTFLDAFAGAGPHVRQYKGHILTEARKYSQQYYLRFPLVLHEAVRIANGVEERFDPSRGYKFSTFLRRPLWWGLTRYCKRMYRLLNGKMSEHQKLALGKPRDEDWEAWERERNAKNSRQRSEMRRRVGWGGRNDPLGIFDRRWGRPKPNEDRQGYRTWKAGIGPFGPNSVARLDEAVDAIRPLLKTEKQRAMLDWVVGDLAGRDSRSMVQAAAEAGTTKGNASKIVASLADHLDAHLRDKSSQ